MDSLSPEIQKALLKCRKEMAAGLRREQELKEENDELKRRLLLGQHGGTIPAFAMAGNADLWRQECIQMQNSLSWKLTKPLRLMKKVLHSLRINGLKLTLLKIVNHRK